MSKEKLISVKFNKNPEVRIRVIDFKNDSPELIEDKNKYPFKLDNTVIVSILTMDRRFNIRIPKGYSWDGATIPQFLWSLVGSKENTKFLIASLVHDYLLQNMKYIYRRVLTKSLPIKDFRKLTTDIFEYILKENGVNKFKAGIMANAVQFWQVTGARGQWGKL